MSFLSPESSGEERMAEARQTSTTDAVDVAVSCLGALRERRPRVHVLTNFVAMNVSANALLAVGAVPSMTFRADAMADFLASSEALVVNLGMLDAEREAAIRRAVPLASELGRPWVLDPVKVERSGTRRDLAFGLTAMGPSVLRANAAEIAVLGDGPPAEQAALRLAQATGGAVAVTGEVDLVTDGARTARIANGTALLDRVTAMGCALSALTGAFLAVERQPLAAATAALLVFAVAGEVAAERALGPGTLVPHLLDALFAMDEATLRARAKVT